jgi:hypothetical protein
MLYFFIPESHTAVNEVVYDALNLSEKYRKTQCLLAYFVIDSTFITPFIGASSVK